MENVIQLFFKNARCFRTTDLILADIKQIKKINNLIAKFLRTQDSKYSNEIINTIIMMDNIYNMGNILDDIKILYIEKDNQLEFDRFKNEFKRRQRNHH